MAFTDGMIQPAPHMPMIIALSLAALITWRLWRFTVVPYLFPREPKVLPYWIPVIGHTVSFFKSADKTLSYGREYFGDTREPFAIVVAGTTIYTVTSADDAILVLKNIENLTFDDYIRDMMLRFGTAPAAVEAMWKHPSSAEPQNPKLTPNPMRKCLAHLQESIMKQHLHPGERLQTLSDQLLGYIRTAMSWDQMPKGAILSESADGRYRTIGLLQWTQEVLLDSATRTIFGDKLLELEPDLFKNFLYFDNNSWLFTFQIPRPWSKEMLAAKDVVQKALEQYFALPTHDRPGGSWLIRTLEDEMRAVGINESKDIAAMLNMIFWVTNGNAYKLCFWILAHLLHNPVLLSSVRTEVSHAIDAQTPVHELPQRLDSCKQLDAVFHEVLRLASSSTAVRNVVKPMEVSGKTLRKGIPILVPFRQNHLNKAAWGANAGDFDPARFLDASAKEGRGASRDPNFRPFGGGTTICPGRFIASVDGTASEGNQHFPMLEEGKPCLGMMSPAEGENVHVRIMPTKR